MVATSLDSLNRRRKGHRKQMVKVEILWPLIGAHAYADSALVHVGQQGPKPPIPDRENRTVIGIALFDDDRVMNPMHRWRYEQNPKNCLKPLGYF